MVVDSGGMTPPATSPLQALAAVLDGPGLPVSLRHLGVPGARQGHMVARVTHAGICGTDLHLQHGRLAIPTPLVLGHEGMGLVHDLGEERVVDVDGAALQVGDRIMWASSIACGRCRQCSQHREPTLCANRRTYGINRPVREFPSLTGAWAQYICLTDGTTIVKVPDEITAAQAMALACAGPTVVHALLHRRAILTGEVVVVQGCGPVGLAAAAFAQLAGASEVIMLGHHASRLKLAASAGIGDRHVLLADTQQLVDTIEHLREDTRGGADVVVDCASTSAAFAQAIGLVRRGGTVMSIGQYTDTGETPVNPHLIVQRQLTILGSWGFSGAHVVDYVRLLPALCARFDIGQLVTSFPLQRVDEAMNAVAERKVMKAILANWTDEI